MSEFEREFTLRISECDVNSLWRLGAMMTEMQETAGDHSDAIGCGRAALMKEGLAWVVARMEILMTRYPTFGERITVRTWHRPTRHRFFPRFFRITDGEGKIIAQASSLWLLMDLETRQSVDAGRLPTPLPDNSGMPEEIPLPKGILSLETPETMHAYTSVYTDLDGNGHVNNTRYVDWLCNALGTETMTAHPPEKLTIHFDSEVRAEQPVNMRLKRDGLRYQMTGIHDGRTAFEISGTLMETPKT